MAKSKTAEKGEAPDEVDREPTTARDARVLEAGETAGPDVFLTPYELSKRWRWAVRERTLRNWRGRNRGPKWVTVAGGPTILYRLADVEQYELEREGKILEGS